MLALTNVGRPRTIRRYPSSGAKLASRFEHSETPNANSLRPSIQVEQENSLRGRGDGEKGVVMGSSVMLGATHLLALSTILQFYYT